MRRVPARKMAAPEADTAAAVAVRGAEADKAVAEAGTAAEVAAEVATAEAVKAAAGEDKGATDEKSLPLIFKR